jgi:sulfopyruvate decarboxylase TPP-binding subunit
MSKVETILASRQDEYGDAIDNFVKIGKIWGALLDIDEIPAYQVALMMDALKTVRLFQSPEHEDSWLDKQGYTQHGYEIATQ